MTIDLLRRLALAGMLAFSGLAMSACDTEEGEELEEPMEELEEEE